MQGLDFGPTQDGAVIVFRDVVSGNTVAANLVDRWTDTEIRVAVPTVPAGNYQVRVDKPTANPGEFVTGATVSSYAAGVWALCSRRWSSPPPRGICMPALAYRRRPEQRPAGRFPSLPGLGSIVKGLQPTLINIGSGGTVPAVAFSDQNTAVPAGGDPGGAPRWPDPLSLVGRDPGAGPGLRGGRQSARSRLSPRPLIGVEPVRLRSDAAAFDGHGVLHVAYKSKQPDTPGRRISASPSTAWVWRRRSASRCAATRPRP